MGWREEGVYKEQCKLHCAETDDITSISIKQRDLGGHPLTDPSKTLQDRVMRLLKELRLFLSMY